MIAYEMDDECTVYAADSAEEAVRLYIEDTGEAPGEAYPRQLTDNELDLERVEYDDDERPTDRTTTLRKWLEQATESGCLCMALG